MIRIFSTGKTASQALYLLLCLLFASGSWAKAGKPEALRETDSFYSLASITSSACAGCDNRDSTNATAQPDTPVGNEEEQVEFVPIEEMPRFQNADFRAFTEWVHERIDYPAEGKAVVQFVIESDGRLAHIQIMQTTSEQLSEEVIRVLKQSPLWTPGTLMGTPVRIKYTLPIRTGQKETAQEAVDAVDSDDETICLTAEHMPLFNGADGLPSFRKWVCSRIRYPEEAAIRQAEGRVVAEFVIEKDGTLSNIRILKAPDEALGQEVVRVLRQSPRWIPGQTGGRPVRIKAVIPVDFKWQTQTENPDYKPLWQAEIMPTFQGGDFRLFAQWVKERINYPVGAQHRQRWNTNAVVLVQFTVEADGSLDSIIIKSTPDPQFAAEVIRVLHKSPAWTPGFQDGKAVSVRFLLPVVFQMHGPQKRHSFDPGRPDGD